MNYLPALGKFKQANTNLSSRQIALLDWLKVHAIELTNALDGSPRTLLHGDFRLDNLCFDDHAGEVLIFDWQTMQQGSPGNDLAYFLSASVGPDEVDELVEYYRQGLINNGIEISAERIRWEYEAGMMSLIHRISPLFFQDQIELGDGRGPEVMQRWIDRTFEKLESVDFEDLLERIPAS